MPAAISSELVSALQKSGSAKMNAYASSPSVFFASKNGADSRLW